MPLTRGTHRATLAGDTPSARRLHTYNEPDRWGGGPTRYTAGGNDARGRAAAVNGTPSGQARAGWAGPPTNSPFFAAIAGCHGPRSQSAYAPAVRATPLSEAAR